jgi:hypothetical protein
VENDRFYITINIKFKEGLTRIGRTLKKPMSKRQGFMKCSMSPTVTKLCSKKTHALTMVSCSVDSSLKMEAICCSEKLVDFQLTTRRYILGNSTLHNHSVRTKPYNLMFFRNI